MFSTSKWEKPLGYPLRVPLNTFQKWVHNRLERVLATSGEVDKLISLTFEVNLPVSCRKLVIGQWELGRLFNSEFLDRFSNSKHPDIVKFPQAFQHIHLDEILEG